MSQGPTKLFKAAKEYNVSTSSIVETLESKGFSIDNKPSVTVTVDMLQALDEVYGIDKRKSQEFEKQREDYHELRNTFKSRQNQSLSIDNANSLDSLEDLLPIEPISNAPILDLEPIETPTPIPVSVEKAKDKIVEEVISNIKEQDPILIPIEEKPVQKVEESPKVEEAPAKEPEEVVEASVEVVKEKIETKLDNVEQPAKVEKTSEVNKVITKKVEKVEAVKPEILSDDEDIIRAQTEKLQGTKVIGKVELRKNFEVKLDQKKGPQLKKKERTVRPNRENRDGKPATEGQTSAGRDANRGRHGEQRPAGSSSPDRIKQINQDESPTTEFISDDGSKPRKKRLKKRDSVDTTPSKSGVPSTSPNTTVSKDLVKSGKKTKGKGRSDSDEEEGSSKPANSKLKLNQGGSNSVANNKKRSKLRKKKREEMAAEREEVEAALELERSTTLEVAEFITASDLAELLNVGVCQIISSVFSIGIMISINQRLDASTIELIANQFGKEVNFITADELLEDELEEDDDPSELEPRAPVVTIMGHVDHGKTSLLDYIRRTKVAAGEAGGITQHIGAYSVTLDGGRKIAFLDTPGHEAFTAMRARGAQVTDIVILVVAADDAVMPQTIEAVNHAQAAGVPIIVAINKIDKPGSNPAKIKQQLTEHSVVVEEYGGSTQVSEVSAKMGMGIDELLEKILVEAELLELKANPSRYAQGIVLESRIDKGKGVVANVLVQNGTLDVGDVFIAGQYSGRVRAMENELGQRLKSVGPSTPIQLTGFDGIPQAGDKLIGMEDERKAKEIAVQRQQIKREQSIRMVKHMTLDDLSRRIALGEVSDLNIIIKGDVDGSIEALSGTLIKLSTDEVKVKIIHTGVGAISESDVLLASASDAIIIGFQVRPTANARKLAEQESIDIRLFSVIYEAVDEVKIAMEGLLSPEVREKILGTAEVREIFKVPSVGTVAGCYVTDGKILRNAKLRLIRDGIVVYNGDLGALKRFKDDVKEVATGYECGISIHNFNDIKISDVIEAYENYEVKRKLA